MFQIQGFVTKAKAPSSDVQSTTLAEVLQAAADAGHNLPEFNFTHSTKWKDREGFDKNWLVFGTFKEDGIGVVEGEDVLKISIGNKIKFNSAEDDIFGKLNEIVENAYPVYFGESVIPEEPIIEGGIEVGRKPARTSKWLTIGTVGSMKATPAGKFDLKNFLNGVVKSPDGTPKAAVA